MPPVVTTSDVDRRAARVRPDQHTIRCTEIWSANSNVAHSVALPGLQGWVYSAPIELGENGGDIHYLSVCEEGILCRVALADVSGHGRAVSGAAERLLRLMRQHINLAQQREFMHDLSLALQEPIAGDRVTFATALVVGFEADSGRLTFTNAGHPPPLWYQAANKRWQFLREARADESRPIGFPLGMDFSGSTYADRVVELGVGDLLVCYTDGVSEATDSSGRQIGEDLLALVEALPLESPKAAGATLVGLVDAFRNGEPMLDDETLIVLRRVPAA